MKKLIFPAIWFASGFMCCICFGINSIIKERTNPYKSELYREGYAAGYFAAKKLFTEEDDFFIDD